VRLMYQSESSGCYELRLARQNPISQLQYYRAVLIDSRKAISRVWEGKAVACVRRNIVYSLTRPASGFALCETFTLWCLVWPVPYLSWLQYNISETSTLDADHRRGP
jgi:hypothetical protein